MQAEKNINPQITVITYHGKHHKIPYDETFTVGQLKALILSIDDTVPQFDFLYAGRMIRTNDKILGDFMNKQNLTIYTNAKGVHGGCFKVGNMCG